MNALSLQTFLRTNIPLTRALGVDVIEASTDRVLLSAPLEPNLNHRDTVFGGSASAVAILSAWAILYLRFDREGIRTRIVIQKNTMQYDRPIAARFESVSTLDPAAWDAFLSMFRKKRRARITVESTLTCNGETVGVFRGDFVAWGVDDPA